MLEEQNPMLSHIMDNILQDHYQGLSQTSLTNGLSQTSFTFVVEQARLCNLLAAHMKKINSTPLILYYHHRSYQWTLQRKKGRAGTASEHFPKWI
jgi:hypothetical protein